MMCIKFKQTFYLLRGVIMFISIVIAMVIKYHSGETTGIFSFLAGLILLFTGESIRMWGAAYLRGSHAVTEPMANDLCTSGPFAYIRHPLYLANFIIGIGLCMMLDEWYAYIIYILFYICVYAYIIPDEELFLVGHFGRSYVDYQGMTRMLFPWRKKYTNVSSANPDWKMGLLKELPVPLILAAITFMIYILFMEVK